MDRLLNVIDFKNEPVVVKLREREGKRVDSGSRLSIVDIDCQLSISISLKLYIKVGCHQVLYLLYL